MDEQRRTRRMDERRQAYLQMLSVVQMPRDTADDRRAASRRMQDTLSLVRLEGPSEVVAAAYELAATLQDGHEAGLSVEEEYGALVGLMEDRFIQAARRALGIAPELS
ncbi:hypothetical protein [Streptomyces sp. V1I6]|uniref:hypothetical protein n=1 Tax=Streptomyces sp. V1I6 TaxID=3042273 RepID=UPI0027876603|nr:hypothetical protein [Streptomyces sp. V1I6]MDQ0840511.1 hypothetical protein [Streptomyces sp. V1I6]